ncbi:MAG: hypothetical protein E6G94_16840 [Alphaproteobacteria bacterium]|nr:MAG: hypothetical protein E6G94_16840 [Alphaproteobacteria bacterium]
MKTGTQRFRRSVVSRAAITALWGTAAMLAAQETLAQQTSLERVEITGSAIRRVDAETALPVVVIQRADIERSGATSVVDLMQRLPSIQGSTGESASVGGETFGFSGISVHDLGESRTLVLLNGHRMAIFGGQTLTGFAAGFDLNALPIAAIERVEVLTDGASALYGSDAVAGVVNFITKRGTTDGQVSVGYSAPRGGAKETRFSVTKGLGDLDKDGWNVLASYAHDERTKLDSVKRDFASTGKVLFSNGGKNYRFQQFSASPIPANVADDNGNLVSPWLITHGSCPAKTFHVVDGSDNFCGFDFVGELEIFPVRKRDAGFLSATVNLGAHQAYADLLVSQSKQTSRIAPVPGSISIPTTSPLFSQYLAPVGITQDTVAFYRLYDLGKRTSSDKADFMDFVAGIKGTVFSNWDYDAFYTHSQSKAASSISGYPGALAISKLRKSGLLNPFVLAGEQTPAAQAAIAAVNYNGYWNGGKSTLDTFNLRGSTELTKLPAGPLAMAAGINYNREKFQSAPSLFAQGLLADPVAGTLCDPSGANPALPCDQRFGDAAATVPYSADRKNYGVFAELQIPVIKDLEVTLSARHQGGLPLEAVADGADPRFGGHGLPRPDGAAGRGRSAALRRHERQVHVFRGHGRGGRRTRCDVPPGQPAVRRGRRRQPAAQARDVAPGHHRLPRRAGAVAVGRCGLLVGRGQGRVRHAAGAVGVPGSHGLSRFVDQGDGRRHGRDLPRVQLRQPEPGQVLLVGYRLRHQRAFQDAHRRPGREVQRNLHAA